MAGEMALRIGQRIRRARAEKGWNQRQLADSLGGDAINNQRISDWERGVHQPNERNMDALASALEKPVAWFYERDPERADGSPDVMGALVAPDAPPWALRLQASVDMLQTSVVALSDLLGDVTPDALRDALEAELEERVREERRAVQLSSADAPSVRGRDRPGAAR